MPTLTDLLQATEVAISSAWPENAIHPISSAGSVLLNGNNLTMLNTRLLKPSTHPFLANQTFDASGFRYGGEIISFPKTGTQPYSGSLAHNLVYSGSGARQVQLFRQASGVLKLEVNDDGSYEVGAARDASYSTTIRRDVQFVIVHACAGGGGGAGDTGINGQGGGSGAVASFVVDLREFIQPARLTFIVPDGGLGGDGFKNGTDGGALYIRYSTPSYSGQFILYGGQRGGHSGGSKGAGGLFKTEGTAPPFATLGLSPGTSTPKYQEAGSILPVLSYIDPNPGQVAVSTTQSFLAGGFGKGGDGSQRGRDPGQPGGHGALYIYY